MIGYLEFILVTSYMVVTYHIIALKYRRSKAFAVLRRESRIFLVMLHVSIVATNILLYFWLILKDFNPVPFFLKIIGLLLFAAGFCIIFWGGYYLKKKCLYS